MDDLKQELRAAERAAAAPFVEDPRSQAWYPLFMAAFVTALTAGPVLTVHGLGYLGFPLQALALAAVGSYYLRHHKRAGAVPRMRSAPPEMQRAYTLLLLGAVTALGISVMTWLASGWPAGLAAVFGSSLALAWLYERHLYPRALRLLQQRLA